MKRKYHPGYDSPEARANFATRGIFNVRERKRRRDELLKKFKAEKVVQMFPASCFSSDLEAMKTQLDWLMAQPGLDLEKAAHLTVKDDELRDICQCGSERLIKDSEDPQRMRAVLMCLVFINQFVYTHYREVHAEFRRDLPIPNFREHSFGGHQTPGWFICSKKGYDQDVDWEVMSETFVNCIYHLRRWLRNRLQRPVPELKETLEAEISLTFESQHQAKFRVPIGA